MTEPKKLRVPLEKMYIGFTLAEDVYKDKEVKLISKGNVLTESLLTALKRHGIKHVYIYEK
jgi:hypothetical protein